MSTTEYAGAGWCCIDCLALLANGQTPEHMTPAEQRAWLAEIDRRMAGLEVTLGLRSEAHECRPDFGGMTASEAGGECDCESMTFSWSACDVCGSPLGGARGAVTYWQEAKS